MWLFRLLAIIRLFVVSYSKYSIYLFICHQSFKNTNNVITVLNGTFSKSQNPIYSIYGVCIYIYIYVCVCIYIYICVCIYIYVCVCVYIYIYIYICVCACIYIYIYIYICVCVCVCIYTVYINLCEFYI